MQRSQHTDLAQQNITQHLGHLTDANLVDQAVAGSDLVFHVAAKAGVWGNYESFHEPNVQGTENVLAACRKHGVTKLIYTSTPSVVHSGSSLEGVDESVPYANHFSTHYPATKAKAEKMVLAANDDTLSTVALRPTSFGGLETIIWCRASLTGPVAVACASWVPVTTWSTGFSLTTRPMPTCWPRKSSSPKRRVRAKLISSRKASPLKPKKLINGIVNAAGLPSVEKHISFKAAYRIGAVLEFVFKLFGIQKEPP